MLLVQLWGGRCECSADAISTYLHINVISPELILSFKPLEWQGRPTSKQAKNIFIMERIR